MIIGHKRILDFFDKSIKNNRLAHAYLFFGPSGLGKTSVALELIKKLNNCDINSIIHPDFLITKPEEPKEITINQVREIQHQMNLSPHSAPYKIALIDQADRMTDEASNCFLKTLEEPRGKSVLILITNNFNSILPTISSRCQIIKFLPVANDVILEGLDSRFRGNDKAIINKIIQLSNGRPGVAIQYLNNLRLIEKRDMVINQLQELIKNNLSERYQFAEKISKDIIQARYILACWLSWFRDLILLKIGCSELAVYKNFNNNYKINKIKNIIKKINQTSQILNNSSFNSRLALENLMLEL